MILKVQGMKLEKGELSQAIVNGQQGKILEHMKEKAYCNQYI